MNKVTIMLFMLFDFFTATAQNPCGDESIYLLVRADDIGSFHAANVACIESYQNGIARTTELMPPCAWFLEATEMLKENPGFDVGIHLTLTSEWGKVKWRPLTHCPTLVDEDGYFFPMVWKNNDFPPNSSIQESGWKIEEVEQELRAQIELSLKYLPHISHLSSHMGFELLDPGIGEVLKRLAQEYKFEVNTSGLKHFPGWGADVVLEERIDRFCENLEKLTPGKYIFIEHPAKDSEEMKTVGHTGYENVSPDREWVTRVFTSEKVKQTIQGKGIKLISYADLKE